MSPNKVVQPAIRKETMCIYQIMRIETGEKYIGQTTKKIHERWRTHAHHTSGCTKLKNAIQKYGEAAFELTIIEKCETIAQLNDREVHWINELNTLSPNGYNLMTGGLNHIPSTETREKISKALTGLKRSPEDCLRNSLAQLKRPPTSDETKAKHSKYQKGRPKSKEHVKKISEAQVGKIIAPLAENKRKLAYTATQARKDELNPPSEARIALRLYYRNLRIRRNEKINAS